MNSCKKLGIDIGSTTVKVSIIEDGGKLLFADYKRHFANIQETLADLLREGEEKLGALTVEPVITGSGGLTLSKHLAICPGGCSGCHIPEGLCPADRRCHRAWRRGCENYLFYRRH
jgi:hypothetical protein